MAIKESISIMPAFQYKSRLSERLVDDMIGGAYLNFSLKVESKLCIMRLSVIFFACALFLFSGCEKEEKKAIQDKQKEVTSKSKASNGSGAKEKAASDLTPRWYFGFGLGCVDVDNLCTNTVIVTPGLSDEQDRLDDKMEEGDLRELSQQFFRKVFQGKLTKEQIQNLRRGETALFKQEGTNRVGRDNSDMSYYIGYDPEESSPEEASGKEGNREWVVPLKDKTNPGKDRRPHGK